MSLWRAQAGGQTNIGDNVVAVNRPPAQGTVVETFWQVAEVPCLQILILTQICAGGTPQWDSGQVASGEHW